MNAMRPNLSAKGCANAAPVHAGRALNPAVTDRVAGLWKRVLAVTVRPQHR